MLSLTCSQPPPSMIYVLWALLNVILSLAFIWICIRAAKLIYKHIGWWAFLIFVGGFLSFMFGGSTDDANNATEPTGSQIQIIGFSSIDSSYMRHYHWVSVPVQKNPLSTIILKVRYAKDRTGNNIPLDGFTALTGLSAGAYWNPVSAFITKSADNNTFNYKVNNEIKWQLLGFRLLTQHKITEGEIVLEN